MDLEKEAKRMAAEFEYSKDALNKGVKQFIEEMREGLEKQGAQMSQIPTYVTSVPNGTEKVVISPHWPCLTLTRIGNISRCRSRWYKLSCLLHHPSWQPHLFLDPI